MKKTLKVILATVAINIILLFYCIFFLSKVIDIPFDIYFIIFSVFNAIVLYVAFFTSSGTYKKSNYGSHGSAKWQTEKEAKKNYPSGEYGFVIGTLQETEKFEKDSDKLLIKSISDGLNNQFLVIGPPGTYKTTGFLLPNISYLSSRAEQPDLLMTDPKGEVQHLKEQELKRNGYDVYSIDFIDFEGDSLNVFDYLYSESYILKLSNQITNSLYANERGGTNQGFWKDSLKNILICCIGYYFQKQKLGEIEQFSIKDILSMVDIKQLLKKEEFFNQTGGITLEAFSALKNSTGSAETLSNILVTVKTKLNIFGLSNLQEMLGKTTIPIHKIGMEIKTSSTDSDVLEKQKKELQKIKADTIKKSKFRIKEIKKEYQKECILFLTKYNLLDDEILITTQNVEEYIEAQKDIFSIQSIQYLEQLNSSYKSKIKIILDEKQRIMDLINEKTEQLIEELSVIKEKPIALIIKIPDDDDSYTPVINMILSVIMKTLYETARRTGSNGVALKKDVVLLLDEFGLIGELREFTDKLGGMRGRRIFPVMLIQSIAQLKKVYKEDFQDIISQCDNKLILGVNDTFTSEELVKMLGDETIIVENQSQRKRTWEPNLFYTQVQESQNYGGKKLLNLSELMNVNPKQGILKQRTREPLKFYKAIEKYWEKEQQQKKGSNIKNGKTYFKIFNNQ